jgi:hypothetical protein
MPDQKSHFRFYKNPERMRLRLPDVIFAEHRAPNLRSSDRIIAGLCTLMMRPARVLRSAIVLKTSTLLYFHKMLIPYRKNIRTA